MESYGKQQQLTIPQSDPQSDWNSPQTGLEESMRQLVIGGGSGGGSKDSYPERPGEPNCVYYIRTGSCGYGARCRFNHPRNRTSVVLKEGGEYPEREGQPVCQYYLKTGTSKFGTSCKFHHPKYGGGSFSTVSLNYHGYPLRPGEKECSYYVKTGQCKFGITCKFNHPQPAGTSVSATAPAFYQTVQPSLIPSTQPYEVASNWQVARPPMLSGSYVQGPYGHVLLPSGMVSISGWNPYPAMRIASVFCLAGWLAIYFAKGVISLDIGRVSTGYGMGLLSYVVPVFSPKNLRGGLATLNQLMSTSGVSFALIVGTIISWRTLALIAIVPCFFLFFGLFVIPESPRWLAKIGSQKEFGVALQKLRGYNADVSFEAKEIQEYMDTLQHLPKAKIIDLFQRRYKLSLIICVGLMLIQQLGGIKGISFYVSYIFESAGFPSNLGTIIYGCFQIPVGAIGVLLMDRAGRRPLLLVSASGLVVGSLLVGTSFFMKANELSLECAPALALIGIMTFVGSFGVGMGAVPWVIMAEILPINIKGTTGSLIALVNWFASWMITLSFNFLMSWSSYEKTAPGSPTPLNLPSTRFFEPPPPQ